MTFLTLLIRTLEAPRSKLFLILLAAGVSLVYASTAFQFDFFTGQSKFWNYPIGPWLMDAFDNRLNADMVNITVGYNYLIKSPWTFPLFFVSSLGSPEGTNLVFLDIVPICALLGRVASSLIREVVNPYGIWVLFCFLASGVSASLVLAQAGQRSILAGLSATLLSISAPPFLYRFGHLPLLAHFVLTGSLYLYLTDSKEIKPLKRFLVWSAWLQLALFCNPYLFTMTCAIYGASVLHSWRVSGFRFRILEPVFIAVQLALGLWLIGFIGSGAAFSGGGYGVFSQNLLSPFLPQRSGLLPGFSSIVDATGGQYEGFNYFGIGIICVLVLAAILGHREILPLLRRHFELVTILIAMILFSVSNQVFFGQNKILSVNIGWKLGVLANIFRSSGRMFWPAYYTALLVGLTVLFRSSNGLARVTIVVLCCALQLVDTEPLRARLSQVTTHTYQPFLDEAEWTARIARSDGVVVYPTYFCTTDAQQLLVMNLSLYAARVGRTINTVYNPRLYRDCNIQTAAFRNAPVDVNKLYVILAGYSNQLGDWKPDGLACGEFEHGKWCSKRVEIAVGRPDSQ